MKELRGEGFVRWFKEVYVPRWNDFQFVWQEARISGRFAGALSVAVMVGLITEKQFVELHGWTDHAIEERLKAIREKTTG